MRKILNLALLSLLSVLVAGPSFGQAVAYSGKLQIGFGDQDNMTGFRSNNAIPICAGKGPIQNPGTVGTTIGTLAVNARGTAAPGVGGALTFNAVNGATVGGAQEADPSTCVVAIPGFANPRLRSRTQVGEVHWPGRRGAYTTMYTMQPVPTNPTATYMLSAGNGNTQTVSSVTWTTMATPSATVNTFMGPALSTNLPFFGAGNGIARLQPGAARFGGGVPYSGGGGVQLGINFAVTFMGDPLVPGDYGKVSYANGFLPTDPQLFGTDAKGINILNQITNVIYTTGLTYTAGLIAGRQDLTYAARTPGASVPTVGGNFESGAVLTVGGGNTNTPMGTFMAGPGITFDCVTQLPFGPCPQVVSPVAFTGAFFEWTTGAVTHTDKGGDFTTIRKASGFDVAVSPGSAVGGETRRLQVVSPWAAAIRPVGPFGLPVPSLSFGGVAILNVNIIPVPEPGTLAMLGFGVVGLVGLGAARRRNR